MIVNYRRAIVANDNCKRQAGRCCYGQRGLVVRALDVRSNWNLGTLTEPLALRPRFIEGFATTKWLRPRAQGCCTQLPWERRRRVFQPQRGCVYGCRSNRLDKIQTLCLVV